MIVQRKLKTDKNGFLLDGDAEIDIEEREIWQPWIKPRCDFVVRYIVPSRVNIIKMFEAKKRFSHELEIVGEDEKGGPKLESIMTFKPRLFERLLGKRNIVIRRDMKKRVPGFFSEDGPIRGRISQMIRESDEWLENEVNKD